MGAGFAAAGVADCLGGSGFPYPHVGDGAGETYGFNKADAVTAEVCQLHAPSILAPSSARHDTPVDTLAVEYYLDSKRFLRQLCLIGVGDVCTCVCNLPYCDGREGHQQPLFRLVRKKWLA